MTNLSTYAAVLLVLCSACAAAEPGWVSVPNHMIDGRWAPGSCILASGRQALIVGGFAYTTDRCVATADIYDEDTGRFRHVQGRLTYPRDFDSASLLPDGRVLVAGGYNTRLATLSTAEIYEPASDRFSVLPSHLSNPRELFTSTTLRDGRILFAAGLDLFERGTTDTADIFDPGTMSFNAVGDLSQDRFGQAAVLLADGRVLIVGGKRWQIGKPDQALASAEIFDPTTETFHLVKCEMAAPRDRPTATLLADGTVLIAGGQNGSAAPTPCEIFDPKTETFRPVGHLGMGRMAHGAATISSGRIALAGGWSPGLNHTTNTVELYSHADDTIEPGPSLPFDAHDMAFLAFPDGLVLAAGGKQVDGHAPSSVDTGAVWRP